MPVSFEETPKMDGSFFDKYADSEQRVIFLKNINWINTLAYKA